MARKLPRNLPQLMLRAREELLRHFRPIITHFGLTEQQWRIMRVIDELEQVEPRELCEICQILSPSMTGVLARMEDLGLVTKTRMEEDQRRVIITLTPEAEKLAAEMTPLIREQYRIIEQSYGQELIEEVYSVLDKVMAAERKAIAQVTLPAPINIPPFSSKTN